MSGVVSIGSLYSGIAGLELGVLAAFVEAEIPTRIAWQVEIEPFCSRVLAHHFPDVQRFHDVATVEYPPNVDVLVGGFMCTGVSGAGKGAGLGRETRSGHTLHHLLRIISEIRPRFLVIENVASGARRWLPRVVQELRDRGYRPHAVPLGAVDVGAPHLRRRVFVVADRDGGGRGGGSEAAEREARAGARARGSGAAVADRERSGLEVGRVEQARRQRETAERSGGARGEGEPLAHGHGHGREGVGRGGLLDREWPARGDDLDGRGGEDGRPLPEPEPEREQLRIQSRRQCGAGGADPREPRDDGASGNLGDAAESRRAGADGWKTLAALDARLDGLSRMVVRHSFPAGRGEAQFPWEPPRTIPSNVKLAERPAMLKACGNAVVPQCSLVVGRIVVEMGAPW